MKTLHKITTLKELEWCGGDPNVSASGHMATTYHPSEDTFLEPFIKAQTKYELMDLLFWIKMILLVPLIIMSLLSIYLSLKGSVYGAVLTVIEIIYSIIYFILNTVIGKMQENVMRKESMV